MNESKAVTTDDGPIGEMPEGVTPVEYARRKFGLR